MRHDDKRKLYDYFNKIENRTADEKRLLDMIRSSLDEYDIVSISKKDVEGEGFDCKDVDDPKMEEIVCGMKNTYLKNLFYRDLRNISQKIGLKVNWDSLYHKSDIMSRWFHESSVSEIRKAMERSEVKIDGDKSLYEIWSSMDVETQMKVYKNRLK